MEEFDYTAYNHLMYACAAALYCIPIAVLYGMGMLLFRNAQGGQLKEGAAPKGGSTETARETHEKDLSSQGKDARKEAKFMSLSSSSAPVTPAAGGTAATAGFVDVLLHNVSHVDMVLNVGDDNAVWTLAKPRFNQFGPIGEMILDAVKDGSTVDMLNVKSVSAEANERGQSMGQLQNLMEGEEEQVPAGFDLTSLGLSIKERSLKFQAREKPSSTAVSDVAIPITAVYFPLLATLVRKWLRGKEDSATQKIMYLVSGVGTPIDSKGDYRDNSTQPTSRLMKLMIEKLYPNINVVCVHSHTNLFRYDENIVFVKKDLLPRIHALRDDLAETTEDWRAHLALTVSFADGSSARVGAINASLRNYRPNYMHFWQLKRFWKEQRLCDDDVEYHSFTEIATIPAVPVGSRYSEEARLLVEEMNKFREDFTSVRCLESGGHDLAEFWMRKTKKPVLCVLLVRSEGKLRVFRGTNMEVSMPTGSLCAERNAIGSALGQDLTLRRKDILGVAVLGTKLSIGTGVSTSGLTSPPESPGMSRSGSWNALQEAAETSPSTDSPARNNYRSDSISSQGSVDGGETDRRSNRGGSIVSEDGAACGYSETALTLDTDVDKGQPSQAPSPSRVVPLRRMASARFNGGDSSSSLHESCGPLQLRGTERKLGRTRGRIVKTIAVDPSDRNPLRPCGACSEWLKKISSVNPRFFVVTFTDEACSGIYIEEIDSSD